MLADRISRLKAGDPLEEDTFLGPMITEGDARMTYDLGDRYVIAPAFAFWSDKPSVPQDAKPVPEDFRYSCDTNADWISSAELKTIFEESEYA